MIFAPKKLLSHFLSGKADLTKRAYSTDLEDFRIFLKAASVDDAITRLLGGDHGCGQELIARYQSDMQRRRDLGSATINRRLATLRSLGKQSRILGMVPWVLEAKNVRHEFVRDTRGPGADKLSQLLAFMEAQPKTKDVLRDTAIIRLMTDAAQRRGAICRLNVTDFVPAAGEIYVLEKGKRSKHPKKITRAAVNALAAWMDVRGEQSGAIFINFDVIHHTKTGKRLSGSSIYAILQKRAKEAGIEGKIRPHGVRHTSVVMANTAAGILGHGMDKVRDFAGHAHLRTTELYLDQDRGAQVELAEAVSKQLRAGALAHPPKGGR